MIKTIGMKDIRGRIHHLVFEMAKENLDLTQAIIDATQEHYMTNKGAILTDSEKSITFDDFLREVPNKTCLKHGFIKSGRTLCNLSVNYNTPILKRKEPFSPNRIKELKHHNKYHVVEVAMHFAKIFGVMQTLDDDLENVSFENNIEKMIVLAEKFVETGQMNIPAFFEKHLNDLRS